MTNDERLELKYKNKGEIVMYDLNRFVEAQKTYYNQALSEIKNGEKKSHWMWFIFPQLKGLGQTDISNYYGIENIKEAIEYLKNEYLYNNLIEITKAILNIENKTIIEILGYPDCYKLRSSMTLLYSATSLTKDNKLFKQVLEKYYKDKIYNGIFDELTVKMLKKETMEKHIDDICDFSEVCNSKEFLESNNLSVCFGRDKEKNNVVLDLRDLGNILVGGATGTGKSILMHSILLSLLLKNKKEDVKFIIIDEVGVDYSYYNDIPHLIHLKEDNFVDMTLIGDLLQINNMVDERLNLLNKENCNSIEEYNEKSNNKLPYIFTIIDEFAYYFSGVYTKMVEKKKQLLHDILVKCKKVGIYFICASQRPGTLNKRLRNMFDIKISFKVSSFYDSIIILGQAGAEKLERGDMLLINKGKESIIKAPLPLDSDIERICMGKNKEE